MTNDNPKVYPKVAVFAVPRDNPADATISDLKFIPNTADDAQFGKDLSYYYL